MLALIGAFVAVVASGCGAARESPQPGAAKAAPTPSAERRHEAQAAAKALHKGGALLAGPVWPAAVVSVDECTPRDSGIDLIDCSVGQGVGGEDPIFLQVRMQPGGAVSKVLGQGNPIAGPKSASQTAALLGADDDLQDAPSRTHPYRCTNSPRLKPDGTPSPANATGLLCTTYLRVAKTNVRRYVEFAPDGTATRDYVIK